MKTFIRHFEEISNSQAIYYAEEKIAYLNAQRLIISKKRTGQFNDVLPSAMHTPTNLQQIPKTHEGTMYIFENI